MLSGIRWRKGIRFPTIRNTIGASSRAYSGDSACAVSTVAPGWSTAGSLLGILDANWNEEVLSVRFGTTRAASPSM